VASFLTEDIGRLVKEEIVRPNKKVIQEPRIWINLLSSQPLAFNLFGELRLEEGFLTANMLFKKLWFSSKKCG